MVRGAQGAERALSALEFARLLVARDAQSTIDAALRERRLQLLDPITNRPTHESAGAFVLRSEVMALLDVTSQPRQAARPRGAPEAKPKRASTVQPQKAAPKAAADARWAHRNAFKAKALELANSKAFVSRADAARHAADNLEDKPGEKRERYDWATVDTWLKDAGWAPVAADE